MPYSLKEVAQFYGRPHSTTWKHVQELTKKKLFKKTSPGKYFTIREVKELERLMEFENPIDGKPVRAGKYKQLRIDD